MSVTNSAHHGADGLNQLLKSIAKQQAEERRDGVMRQSLRFSEAKRSTEGAATAEQAARQFDTQWTTLKSYIDFAKGAMAAVGTASSMASVGATQGGEVSPRDAQKFIDDSANSTSVDELAEVKLPKGMQTSSDAQTIGDLYSKEDLSEALSNGYSGQDIAEATLSMPAKKSEESALKQGAEKLMEFVVSQGDRVVEAKNNTAQALADAARTAQSESSRTVESQRDAEERHVLYALRRAVLNQIDKM